MDKRTFGELLVNVARLNRQRKAFLRFLCMTLNNKEQNKITFEKLFRMEDEWKDIYFPNAIHFSTRNLVASDKIRVWWIYRGTPSHDINPSESVRRSPVAIALLRLNVVKTLLVADFNWLTSIDVAACITRHLVAYSIPRLATSIFEISHVRHKRRVGEWCEIARS